MKKSSFEQLTIDTLNSKLKSFRESDDLLKIWQKGQQSWRVKLREVEKKKKDLVITILPMDKIVIDEKNPVLINFELRGVDFFAETLFLKKDSSIIELKITEKVYMVEKRENPRYLCFPEDQVFLVVDIPFPQREQAEVLLFDREKREEAVFLRQFRDKVENPGLTPKEGFETMKFRVLDISRKGLSLCCTEEEYSFFNLEEYLKTGYILVDEKIYNIKILRNIYIVDYIVPKARALSMKKIGIEIEESDVLNDYLDTLSMSERIFTQEEKDFEDMRL